MSRENYTPKFRGIYDKAMTGRSMKAAIDAKCLECMNCKTKEIRNCQIDCPLWKYRPYQERPYRVHRPTSSFISPVAERGKISVAPRPIERVIDVEKIASKRLRLKVSIQAEEAKTS